VTCRSSFTPPQIGSWSSATARTWTFAPKWTKRRRRGCAPPANDAPIEKKEETVARAEFGQLRCFHSSRRIALAPMRCSRHLCPRTKRSAPPPRACGGITGRRSSAAAPARHTRHASADEKRPIVSLCVRIRCRESVNIRRHWYYNNICIRRHWCAASHMSQVPPPARRDATHAGH
jgi:hypothetical protein